MEQTWRWFGPDDPVSLDHIRQAGATGIVTALHDKAPGEEWTRSEIAERKRIIEDTPEGRNPLRWAMVESVPVHDDIKIQATGYDKYIETYCRTLRNLAVCGIDRVCYNFMPLIDWTRTDLAYRLPSGATALRFDADQFAAFDLFLLQREGAAEEYSPEQVDRAQQVLAGMSEQQRQGLISNIIAGLPGRATEAHTLDGFRSALQRYAQISSERLQDNLIHFLEQVVPVAAEVGIKLAIHPDDPPRPLLGLPRVVSCPDDLRTLFSAVPDLSNGLTLCVGTFGVRPDNNLVEMAHEFGERIHFAHLRGIKREADGLSFFEGEHLASDADMVAIIDTLLKEEAHRKAAGRADHSIPIRPDHGHQLLDDLDKKVNPGYSAIGRLKGLAEIRGVIAALNYQRNRSGA
ncbi:MAG: mannonate dehydratase [Desulfuromonadales bacterium]|nr:mannonate dehydratase [Desulfuromonadales bacterium]